MSTQNTPNTQVIKELVQKYEEALKTNPRAFYDAVKEVYEVNSEEEIFNIINMMTATIMIGLKAQV